MTFEELKEMVDATINENGSGQITGKALNLAFMEVLNSVQEYVEENSSKGGGGEVIYLMDYLDENGTPSLSPEHKLNNANVIAKCKECVQNNTPFPSLVVDGTGIILSEAGAGANIPEGALIACIMSTRFVAFMSNADIMTEQFGQDTAMIVDVDEFGKVVVLGDGSVLLSL